MAGKKKLVGGLRAARGLPNATERFRNRASSQPVVKLYEHLTAGQKDAIVSMELGSMLNIKCHLLHNPLINWIAGMYDKHTREFVIHGRGRIPLTPESVYRTLGLPRGQLIVPYCNDPDIEARLGPLLFPGQSSTPKTSLVGTILEKMTGDGVEFKQVYLMHLVSTLLNPNTCNKVSNRCYPLLDMISDVPNMNLCKFVCDMLHDELASGKPSGGCLFHVQLLYVDSLDITQLNIELPEGPFVANRWSKADIDAVLDADLKIDGSGFGNLELKPHLAMNNDLFGGPGGYDRWFNTSCHPECPSSRKAKVGRLMGDFASGITSLMCKLIQGWTEPDDIDDTQMEQAFRNVASVSGVELPKDADTAKISHLSLPVKQHPSNLSKKGCPVRKAAADDDNNVKHCGSSMRGILSPSEPLVSLSPAVGSIKAAGDAASSPIQLTRVTRSASKVLQFGEGSTFAQSPADPCFSDGDTYADEDESDFDDPDASDRYVVMSRDRSDLHREEIVVIAASDCNYVTPQNVIINSAAPDIVCDIASDDPVRLSVEFSDLDLIASTAVGEVDNIVGNSAHNKEKVEDCEKNGERSGNVTLVDVAVLKGKICEAVLKNDDYYASQSEADSIIQGVIGDVQRVSEEDLMLNDNALSSDGLLSNLPGMTIQPADAASMLIAAASCTVASDHALEQTRKRRLHSGSSEVVANVLKGVDNPVNQEKFIVTSPPKKLSKVYVKKLKGATTSQPTRSSPRRRNKDSVSAVSRNAEVSYQAMKSTLNNIGSLSEEVPISDHVSPNEYIVREQDSIFDQKDNDNIRLSSFDVEFNSAGMVAEKVNDPANVKPIDLQVTCLSDSEGTKCQKDSVQSVKVDAPIICKTASKKRGRKSKKH